MYIMYTYRIFLRKKGIIDMSSKTATIRFKNGEKWEEFIEAIEENHGTSRGYIGSTVEQLIEIYLQNPDITANKINSILDDNQRIKNELKELELSNNDEQLSNLKSQNKELTDDINTKDTKINELVNELDNINTMLKEIEEKNRKLNNRNIELEKKNLELNSKLEYPERENKLLQKNYQQLEETYKQLKEDNKSINAMFETINNELKQQQKDTRTARSDYKHIVETLNKLQKEYNNLQNENKEYRVIFAEIKKMSLKERIFGEYPDDIKELTSGK